MNYSTIIYEKKERLAIITLNRPDSFNAINSQMLKDLDNLLDEIISDTSISAVILTGHKKFFAAGADIKEISQNDTPVSAHKFIQNIQGVFDKLERVPVPVIAAVSGLALGGGCEMSMACDIRIAAENAKFGQPEINIGVIPGAGGTQRLPRLVGIGRAKELLFTGDPIGAQEAYRIGLVNKIVPIESLLDEAKKMALKFIDQPGYTLKILKMAVNDGMNMDLRSATAYEARCFEQLASTKDQREGLTAFVEKRKPVYKGM